MYNHDMDSDGSIYGLDFNTDHEIRLANGTQIQGVGRCDWCDGWRRHYG